VDVGWEKYGTGETARLLRFLFAEYTPTELKETIEQLIAEIAPGARLLEHEVTPGGFDGAPGWRIRYLIEDHCQRAGDLLIFRFPGIKETCSGARKSGRRYPLVYETGRFSEHEAAVNIPRGYAAYHLPEPVHLVNPYFEYHTRYEQTDGEVKYQSRFITRSVEIPVEGYEAYSKACKEMASSGERFMVFRKK
jgi:hypothetical protein